MKKRIGLLLLLAASTLITLSCGEAEKRPISEEQRAALTEALESARDAALKAPELRDLNDPVLQDLPTGDGALSQGYYEEDDTISLQAPYGFIRAKDNWGQAYISFVAKSGTGDKTYPMVMIDMEFRNGKWRTGDQLFVGP